MPAPCFPCGFSTGTARSPRGVDRIWSRCTNAEPGTLGHEYEEPAAFSGASAEVSSPASASNATPTAQTRGALPGGRHCR